VEGLGAVVIGIALSALLVWAGVIVNARRIRRDEETPKNLQPFLTDDDLESKRVGRVLLAALVASAVLALVIPIYYLSEADRQAEATETRVDFDIEEGEHWFEEFQCAFCHGGGSGGGATFIEPRSGLETSWAAPSLNDVFLRYDEDEVRFWIVFGRNGSPMPAAGLEGGGSMTSQQVDQVIAYIRSIQVDQSEAVAQVENKVSIALDRIDRGAESLAAAIADQTQEIADIRSKPAVWNQAKDIPGTIAEVISSAGTCRDESAELIGQPCRGEGADSDRDGIADAAETQITALFRQWGELTDDDKYAVDFDPSNAFTAASSAGDPIFDLDQLDTLLEELEVDTINLRVAALNNAGFVETAEQGLAYLEQAAVEARYAVDFEALAAEAFDGDLEQARRAVGLFNGYCARCHTAGYSAGVAFQQEAGSGAWGPSLRDGKALRQFPDIEGHFDFIARGSQEAVGYGVNGLGNGWMPAFGFTLSRDDIMLIVEYERAM
jgi:mono/diheme cytochrome c family protein